MLLLSFIIDQQLARNHSADIISAGTHLVSSTLPFEQRETKFVKPMPISFSR